MRGVAKDFLAEFAADAVYIGRGAVVNIQAERDGADVKVFGVQHLDGRKDFVGEKHADGILGTRQALKLTFIIVDFGPGFRQD